MNSILKYILAKMQCSASSPITNEPNKKCGYDLDEEANKSIQVVNEYTMLTYPRLVTLYQQVVFCEAHDIKGSYVECGTWKGGSVGLMALGNMQRSSKRRHIHLFDSFEGIPEPELDKDGEKAVRQVLSVGGKAEGKLDAVKGFYEKYSDGVGTLEINKRLLEDIIGYESKFLHYHKGWFQDTLPVVSKDLSEIAILRIDGDWYASTKVCLEHLYDKVVRGGFIIIDDYGYYEGCKLATDEFIRSRNIQAFLNHIDSAARYWIKP